MSLQTIVNIFILLFAIGIIAVLFVLVRDRIDIIRSIKPKNVRSFFAYYEGIDIIDYIIRFLSRYRNPLIAITINTFALIVWVPIWLIDKCFKLNIFEDQI